MLGYERGIIANHNLFFGVVDVVFTDASKRLERGETCQIGFIAKGMVEHAELRGRIEESQHEQPRGADGENDTKKRGGRQRRERDRADEPAKK